MKDVITKTFRGHQFEFKRMLSSSFDPWYHISVTLNKVIVNYRMHTNNDGTWKITVKRLPWLIYSLEGEFNDFLQLNEGPGSPDSLAFRHPAD
jgi:hypothetical protein